MFQMELEGPSGAVIHNVEENIEWWATQSMPAAIDPLLDLQETLPGPMPSDFTVSEPTLVCYGMVSNPFSSSSLLLASLLSNIRRSTEPQSE